MVILQDAEEAEEIEVPRNSNDVEIDPSTESILPAAPDAAEWKTERVLFLIVIAVVGIVSFHLGGSNMANISSSKSKQALAIGGGRCTSDVVNTCILADKPEPTGPYQAYSGDTKVARAHIIFGDISPDETETILNTLQTRDTRATFFTHSDRITDETKPLLQRMIAEGHTIGSMGQSSNPPFNFLYANNALIQQQITSADADFKDAIGFVPTLYMPSFGALDSRGQKILKENGKTIVMWSSGANGWWFVDNNEPLETAVAALRYTMPEAGGIILMPTNAAILEQYLNQVWPYWKFVDFTTCTGHSSSNAKAAKVRKSAKTKAAKRRAV